MVTGGVESMLVGVAVAAAVCLPLGWLLSKRLGAVTGWAWALFLFTVACIAVLTLTPAYQVPEVIPAEQRPDRCSFDYGGPSPDGFWILSGGQRMLNTLVFIPAGLFWVLAVSRARAFGPLVLLGLAGLIGFSVMIEWTQLELARIDRACDVTDLVDNSVGAVIGMLGGLVLAAPRRAQRRARDRRAP